MLQIDIINVGDGDAILIQDFSGTAPFRMLIDCGRHHIESYEGSKRQYAIDYLYKSGISEIDLLVLSHMHTDHFGGCLLMLPHIRFKKAFVNYLPSMDEWKRTIAPESSTKSVTGLYADFNLYRDVLAGLLGQGCNVAEVQQTMQLQPTPQLLATIYAPPPSLIQRYRHTLNQLAQGEQLPNELLHTVSKDRNNSSLMVFLSYAGKTIFLPGDNYAAYLETTPLPRADVLKLPHHGDEKSLSFKMLEMIAPDTAAISCRSNIKEGKNRPDQAIVEMLQQHCALFCTENRELPALPAATHDTIRIVVSENGALLVQPT